MKVKKAVIVTSGWSTHFLPVTKAQPKEMLPLVDRPIINMPLKRLLSVELTWKLY